jgi:polyphosphate kinase 2 (PPK2 family)
MKTKRLIEKAREIAKPFRINQGKDFRLKHANPGETLGLKGEDERRAKEALTMGIEALAELQDKLYAQDRWAVLLIFQAMDAAGKDGTIKHVMSGVNPQGCQVFSFKSPSAEDLDHDYLWRCMKCLPNLITKKIWEHRFEDIRGFEQYLSNNGVVVRKFFLHLSNEEQQKRFLERIETSDKNWKFSASDAAEREHWDKYMEAYEDMIRNTATEKSPWYVVPADNKWFTRVVVAAAVVETLASLDLKYPEVGKDKLEELAATKAALLKK